MRKWTLIDTLIVVVLIAGAAVGVKVLGSGAAATEKSKVEVVVMASSKDKGFAEAVRIGEKATLSLTEKDGGIVTEVKAEPTVSMTFDSINGTYQNVSNEEKEDVYIYVEADCDVSDKYIKTGGTVIRVGEKISVRGKGYATEGYVVEIHEGGDK